MVTAASTAGANPVAARSTPPSTAPNLGQSDFIRLLTTQLKQQDPTDPVDNKEMIAQMAQFSSLSGIEKINTTLQDINARLDRIMPSASTAQE
ncbi:MAG: flagellar hook assembly protein FlgD [Novosphingobium sp.]